MVSLVFLLLPVLCTFKHGKLGGKKGPLFGKAEGKCPLFFILGGPRAPFFEILDALLNCYVYNVFTFMNYIIYFVTDEEAPES